VDRGEEAEIIDLCTLPSGARPVPFGELDIEEVMHVRALDCECYNQCLTFVARVRWAGFSCRRCPFRSGAHRAAAEEEIEAIAAIIRIR
jgi:hypothetical protein